MARNPTPSRYQSDQDYANNTPGNASSSAYGASYGSRNYRDDQNASFSSSTRDKNWDDIDRRRDDSDRSGGSDADDSFSRDRNQNSRDREDERYSRMGYGQSGDGYGSTGSNNGDEFVGYKSGQDRYGISRGYAEYNNAGNYGLSDNDRLRNRNDAGDQNWSPDRNGDSDFGARSRRRSYRY